MSEGVSVEDSVRVWWKQECSISGDFRDAEVTTSGSSG